MVEGSFYLDRLSGCVVDSFILGLAQHEQICAWIPQMPEFVIRDKYGLWSARTRERTSDSIIVTFPGWYAYQETAESTQHGSCAVGAERGLFATKPASLSVESQSFTDLLGMYSHTIGPPTAGMKNSMRKDAECTPGDWYVIQSCAAQSSVAMLSTTHKKLKPLQKHPKPATPGHISSHDW